MELILEAINLAFAIVAGVGVLGIGLTLILCISFVILYVIGSWLD